ncbi:hypothetical protein TNCV_1595991, partial [Trichonephila clavipes]
IRQFTQGTPNCNTNPKATVFGIPKNPYWNPQELITSRLTGAGSLLPPVYEEKHGPKGTRGDECWVYGARAKPGYTAPHVSVKTLKPC